MKEQARSPTGDSEEVEVRVLFFSLLRERTGLSNVKLQLAEHATVDDVLARLSVQFSAIVELRRVLRVALNAEYVDGSVQVQNGDELALITPVSGG